MQYIQEAGKKMPFDTSIEPQDECGEAECSPPLLHSDILHIYFKIFT